MANILTARQMQLLVASAAPQGAPASGWASPTIGGLVRRGLIQRGRAPSLYPVEGRTVPVTVYYATHAGRAWISEPPRKRVEPKPRRHALAAELTEARSILAAIYAENQRTHGARLPTDAELRLRLRMYVDTHGLVKR